MQEITSPKCRFLEETLQKFFKHLFQKKNFTIKMQWLIIFCVPSTLSLYIEWVWFEICCWNSETAFGVIYRWSLWNKNFLWSEQILVFHRTLTFNIPQNVHPHWHSSLHTMMQLVSTAAFTMGSELWILTSRPPTLTEICTSFLSS